jgi:bifunctional ADP-heptose synthase (sugar kinase/adenylyltransferase)
MITLSEKGMCLSDGKSLKMLPAHVRNISDVSGAGDTVISVAALAMVSGLSPRSAAQLANLAGGLVCEKVGVVPVDKLLLMKEAELIGIT